MTRRVRRFLMALVLLALCATAGVLDALPDTRAPLAERRGEGAQRPVGDGAPEADTSAASSALRETAVVPDAAADPFASPEACRARIAARAPGARSVPRIGTWNVRWFPRGTAKGRDPSQRTDVAWLACSIAALEFDVLALQEIILDHDGRGALLDLTRELDALTGGRWRSHFDDCAEGQQHVGLLYDETRVAVESPRPVVELNPGASACAGSLRPGYAAYVRFKGGPDLHVVTVHLDSGVQVRDHANRMTSVSRLGAVLATLRAVQSDTDVLVLGDFNAMGCSRCTDPITAAQELAAVDAAARTAGLRRVPMPDGLACSHYYRGRPGVLDLALASTTLRELPAVSVARPEGLCRQLACRARPQRELPDSFHRLSDHCPLVLDLTPRDLD